MKINPEIEILLQQYNIDLDEGLLYLLSVHFKLNIDERKFEQTIRQINFTKIVDREYTEDSVLIKWNMPLFVEETKYKEIDDE